VTTDHHVQVHPQTRFLTSEVAVKLIVFGASRGVGRQLTDLALSEGHHVTAAVRDPSTFGLNHESLEVVAGDITDADSVRRCMRGHDVAFCTVGARNRGATTLYSTAARNLASAMDNQEARRLTFSCRTSVCWERRAPTFVQGGTLLFAKLTLRPWLEDHRRALDELRKHDWEWIAVRPMRLTDGPRSGHYRVALDGLPKGFTHISRADVADFTLKQLTSDEYVHQVPAIAD
jgi:putative NADH-flavin reductase